jgi:hypothetical protein
MANYQIQFIRQRRAVPLTRDYMMEAEQGYLAKAVQPICTQHL